MDDHFISAMKKEAFYFEAFRQYQPAKITYWLTKKWHKNKMNFFFFILQSLISPTRKHGSNFTTPTVPNVHGRKDSKGS